MLTTETDNDLDGFELDLKAILEGALFAAGKPMSIKQLQALFGEDAAPEAEYLEALLSEITEDFRGRGVVLTKVASGYRFQVNQSVGQWVSRLWEEKPARYSRALLETLALVAYRQPVTRGEIEEVRGVSVSSHIMKTLLEREWVRVVGHKDVPGRPAMYATTRLFLDYFNLSNLDELPSLPDIQSLDLTVLDAAANGGGDEGGDSEPQQMSLPLEMADEEAQAQEAAQQETGASGEAVESSEAHEADDDDDENADRGDIEGGIRTLFDDKVSGSSGAGIASEDEVFEG